MDSHTGITIMPDISISQSGIHQLLTTLNEHKASGPDCISPYILKHCADEVTPILRMCNFQSISVNKFATK